MVNVDACLDKLQSKYSFYQLASRSQDEDVKQYCAFIIKIE